MPRTNHHRVDGPASVSPQTTSDVVVGDAHAGIAIPDHNVERRHRPGAAGDGPTDIANALRTAPRRLLWASRRSMSRRQRSWLLNPLGDLSLLVQVDDGVTESVRLRRLGRRGNAVL
jgi:hypothetical protein